MNAPRRRLVFARCAVVVLAQLCAARALADGPRVVLVSPDAELERAARAALEPWQVDLRIAAAQTPGSRAPLAHDVARQIALAEAAVAVVWISEDEGGIALWIYDRADDDVVVRPLGGAPPFDAPTAAAVALSVKTLLRHSESAPPDERYGARSAEPVVVPPASIPSAPAARPESAEASARLSGVDVEVRAALRFRFSRAGSMEPRAGLGVAWWPQRGGAGVLLRVLTGPGISVSEPRFRGRLNSTTAGLAAAFRGDVLRGLRISGAAGLIADVTRLDGFVPDQARSIDAMLRLVPALALELGIDWVPTPVLRVGLRGSGAWLVRTQRYLVGAEPVLEVSRGTFEGALVLAFAYPNRK